MIIQINLKQAVDLLKHFDGDQTKVLTVIYSPMSAPPGELYVIDANTDSKEMHVLGGG